MMDVITMPQLGETVTEGTITLWSKKVGDVVEIDDALFDVSTEKVDTEVPSAVAGFMRAILVAEGDTVVVGAPVAVVTSTADEVFELDDSPSPDGLAGEPHDGSADSVPVAVLPALVAVRQSRSASNVGATLSPVVRRLLAEHDLSPDQVVGTGGGGRVTRADVLATAAQRARTPAAELVASPPVPSMNVGERDTVVDFSKARAVTAEHMVRSLATAAHALVAVEVDYHALDPVRRAAGLSYLPFVARAVIDAIAEFPHLNASVDVDRLIVHRDVHLGIAVDVGQEALMVPVVRAAGDLRVRALSDTIVDLAERARRRRLGAEDLAGGTITVTNVGSYGTLVTTPIINQPQVAILSTDGVRMTPVAVRTDDGTGEREWGLAVHPVGNLSLSFDHRAFDGAYASAFLARVRDVLQQRDWNTEVAL